MNFNETCDLNSDLLSVSGGVLRGAENTPVRRSAKIPTSSVAKNTIRTIWSSLFFSPNVPVISASPPFPSLNSGSSSSLGWASPPQSWNHTRSCAFRVWTVVGPFSFTRCAQFKQTNIPPKKEEQSRMCLSCRRPLDGGVVPESCPVIYSNGDVCRGNVKSTDAPFSSNARSKNIRALLKIIIIINQKIKFLDVNFLGFFFQKKQKKQTAVTTVAYWNCLAFLLKTDTWDLHTFSICALLGASVPFNIAPW